MPWRNVVPAKITSLHHSGLSDGPPSSATRFQTARQCDDCRGPSLLQLRNQFNVTRFNTMGQSIYLRREVPMRRPSGRSGCCMEMLRTVSKGTFSAQQDSKVFSAHHQLNQNHRSNSQAISLRMAISQCHQVLHHTNWTMGHKGWRKPGDQRSSYRRGIIFTSSWEL